MSIYYFYKNPYPESKQLFIKAPNTNHLYAAFEYLIMSLFHNFSGQIGCFNYRFLKTNTNH